MGEFQYSRYPCEEWEIELLKLKVGGVQIVGTYVFWIHHEEEIGSFDWSGRRDLRFFLKLCQKHDLLVCLRIGPFVHGEARNGGLPDWLFGQPFEARSNDPRYLDYVGRLYAEIGRQAAGLTFENNGPVIALQCENEFMDSAAPWETTQLPALEFTSKGTGGAEHMLHLKRLAQDAGLNVPLFTATGWGQAPILEKDFLPLFGGYAFHAWAELPQAPTDMYLFKDEAARKDPRFDPSQIPFASCEMGGGMQVFYKNRPIVPPESVEAMHVTFLGKSTNLIGYYVYHGGSNPVGKRSYLNEHRCPRISYDFQAPIREFGQLAESYHRLRRQFLFLETWGSLLAPMRFVLPANETPTSPIDGEAIRCAVRHSSQGGFLFLNNYQDHFELPRQGPFRVTLDVPGEKMTIPVETDLHLETNVAAIFPFHLNLDGIDLRYSTAQPLTRLENEDGIHYFFFVPQTMKAEFCFTRSGIQSVKAPHALINTVGDHIRVLSDPDPHRQIQIETAVGRLRTITTLTHGQSQRFWKGQMAGRQRVIISEMDLFFRDDCLELLACHETSASLWIFPALSGPLLGPLGDAKVQFEVFFTRYDINLPQAEVYCEVRSLTTASTSIRVAAGAFRDIEELFLRIHCVGDIGTAYLNGQLIHDYFCNELPWELGLRRFLDGDSEHEVVLKVSPKHVSPNGPQIVAGAMANMELVGDQVAGAIKSVEPFVRRRFRLQTN